MLKDRYGRVIKGIRFSVTQRCNLNCFYCHHEGESQPDGELDLNEIEALLKLAAQFGIKKVKFTGGEPLLRADIIQIVEISARFFDDVSMTTNATLLADLARDLKHAGLNRINVSIDTLKQDVYKTITGSDRLLDVITGIKVASKTGFDLLKLNVVVLKNLNDCELQDLLHFGRMHNAVVQFIELNTACAKNGIDIYEKYYFDMSKVENLFAKSAYRIETRNLHNRRKYFLQNGEAEVVRSMHNSEFCKHCTRIRITSDGRIKPCLFQPYEDLKVMNAIRENDMKKAREIFLKAIEMRKPYWM